MSTSGSPAEAGTTNGACPRTLKLINRAKLCLLGLQAWPSGAFLPFSDKSWGHREQKQKF